MDSKLAQQHDDVYAAVFALVGQRPNETYEALTKVLPAIKDADPVELKELAARGALLAMFKPSVDPLRVEYEKAAAEEDIEDLSTEDGEWLGASSKPREDDENLDDDGVPTMKLSRASSSFILDGPGDIKVDNFTPEGHGSSAATVEAANGEACPRAARSSTGGQMPAPATDAGSGDEPPSGTAATAATAAPYVPTAIARARRESGLGTAAAAAPVAAGGGVTRVVGPAVTTAASAPVVTLEDELRAMRLRQQQSRDHQQQHEQQHKGHEQQNLDGLESDPDKGLADAASHKNASAATEEEDEEDVPEVVPELSGPLIMPRPTLTSASGGACGAAAVALAAPPGAIDIGGLSCSDDTAVDAGESPLPGTCLDTEREDSLWAAMQGLSGRGLVEQLGLAGPSSGSLEDAYEAGGRLTQDSGGDGVAVAEGAATAAPLANGGHAFGGSGATEAAAAPARTALANGHYQDDGHGNLGQGSDGGGGRADCGYSGGGRTGGAGGFDGTASGSTDSTDGGAAMAVTAGDGPTFEEVQSFSLDPDFDYDNVKLTVREFPYSMFGSVRVPR